MASDNFLFDLIKSMAQSHADSYTKMFGLHSLYISEHRRSYKCGDQVIIENGKLINSQGEVPTHEITLLEGTLSDSKHVITLIDLTSQEPLKIEL